MIINIAYVEPTSGELLEGGCEGSGVLYASTAPHHFAILENHERGHCLNAILHGQILGLLHIDFNEGGPVANFGFHIFENGVHHFARTTPSGEEIDQNGLVARDELLKIVHSYHSFIVFALQHSKKRSKHHSQTPQTCKFYGVREFMSIRVIRFISSS